MSEAEALPPPPEDANVIVSEPAFCGNSHIDSSY